MINNSPVHKLYQRLFNEYGPQGWWPLITPNAANHESPTSINYHTGLYDYPKSDTQRLEITIGAILAQNTNWRNAATALLALRENGLISVKNIQKTSWEEIALVIKCAGYYNQKARYLKNITDFLLEYPFQVLRGYTLVEARNLLLRVKGIGKETADCILLYGLNQPSFVIDAYTKRIIANIGWLPVTANYEKFKLFFESNLQKDSILFQEYHALFVVHGKKYYSRKPYGKSDWLMNSHSDLI